MTLKDRLLSHVVKNEASGCWEWQGSKRSGYGRMIVGSRKDGTRRSDSAHRISYIVHHGEIPDGIEVCHRCDNRCCVNPDHLFIGTHQENMNDRESKGRNKPQSGEKNGRAKLDKADVLRIREKREKGVPFQKLADEYGVHKKTIMDAVSGKHWHDVSIPEAPKEDEDEKV